MPRRDDYTLGIDEVSKRLNKSVRTIHRYKDSGRLSFVVGPSQGNPLFFSRTEVEALARELLPNHNLGTSASDSGVDSRFRERLERVERLLARLEANPAFEQLLARTNDVTPASGPRMDAMLADLTRLEGESLGLDNKALGRLLIRLGSILLEE